MANTAETWRLAGSRRFGLSGNIFSLISVGVGCTRERQVGCRDFFYMRVGDGRADMRRSLH